MKRYFTFWIFLIVCILFSSTTETKSQTFEIGIWSGLGTYNHSSLRKISAQNFSQKNIPSLSNTDYMPFGSAFGIHLNRVYQDFSFGVFFRKEKSATERAYYNFIEDLYYNQNGSNLLFGIQGKLHLKNQLHKNLSYFPYFSLKSGLNLSSISYSENLELLPSSYLDKFELTSQSFYIEPGFGIQAYRGAFKIEPNLSFFVPIFQSNYKIENEKQLDNLSEENKENTNFLGLRLGVTFGIQFN